MLCSVSAAGQQFRAFWADAFHYGFKNPAEVEQMIADVEAAKCNVIIAEVRLDGQSYYLNSMEPAAIDASYSRNFDALAYLIDRAHARGIQVHAWFPVYPLWRSTRPPADPRHIWHTHGPNATGRDNWMSVSSTGRISTSLDPGHPDAARYVADVIVAVAENYAVDGVHLDYVRYPEDADYGWNPVAIERFNRQANRAGPPQPREAAWSAFRRAQVTSLVRQVYLRSFSANRSVAVTAAVITWGNGPVNDAGFLVSDAYSRVFQDWRSWLEEGILDVAIPMNYFREQQLPAYLDRWMAFEKDRQYRRAVAVGLGNYLNPIADSVEQLKRALAPSPNGRTAWGVSFYSYASTNTLNASGLPIAPNGDFYRSVAEVFGETAAVPPMPWKVERGHAYGWLRIAGAPDWLADRATVQIVPMNVLPVRYSTTTDGTGFFGIVDLPPGSYFAVLERGGVQVTRTAAREIKAGEAARFDFDLKLADFADVIPGLDTFPGGAAPGDIVTLTGRNLAADYVPASAVPLPVELGGTQVLVNGWPAPLFSVDRGRISFQLPYDAAAGVWQVVVRRAGMEATAAIGAVPSRPRIAGVNRAGEYLEIYATGLGMVAPAIPAGVGGPASEPFPRVVSELPVFVNGERVAPLYMGLAPFEPGKYQVNVAIPGGAGALRIQIGDSEPFTVSPAQP